MKTEQIELGKTYTAKIAGKLAPVRLECVSPYGGWDATNTRTHRRVRIHSARKLRGEWKPTRCGKCANCQTLAQEKQTWTLKYRESIDAGRQDTAVALRDGWRARVAALPCEEAHP